MSIIPVFVPNVLCNLRNESFPVVVAIVAVAVVVVVV